MSLQISWAFPAGSHRFLDTCGIECGKLSLPRRIADSDTIREFASLGWLGPWGVTQRITVWQSRILSHSAQLGRICTMPNRTGRSTEWMPRRQPFPHAGSTQRPARGRVVNGARLLLRHFFHFEIGRYLKEQRVRLTGADVHQLANMLAGLRIIGDIHQIHLELR